MRISDWSSDVCSSDLPERLTARFTGELSARSARNVMARRQQARSKSWMRPTCSAKTMVWYGDSPWAKRVRVSKCEISRSEEHTSEIQSLMRISYAVYCLKKKTMSKRLYSRLKL